jgi:hypothetical protein
VGAVLTALIPGLAGAARIERPSTSSCLRNTVTGESFAGSGGEKN